MESDWEEFDAGQAQARDRIFVSLSFDGNMLFNRIAMEELGAPEAVTLHFDRLNDRIGVKPSTRFMPNSFSMRVKRRGSGRVIRVKAFMDKFGIKLDHTMRFVGPKIEEGMLIVSLRQMRRSELGRR